MKNNGDCLMSPKAYVIIGTLLPTNQTNNTTLNIKEGTEFDGLVQLSVSQTLPSFGSCFIVFDCVGFSSVLIISC